MCVCIGDVITYVIGWELRSYDTQRHAPSKWSIMRCSLSVMLKKAPHAAQTRSFCPCSGPPPPPIISLAGAATAGAGGAGGGGGARAPLATASASRFPCSSARFFLIPCVMGLGFEEWCVNLGQSNHQIIDERDTAYKPPITASTNTHVDTYVHRPSPAAASPPPPSLPPWPPPRRPPPPRPPPGAAPPVHSFTLTEPSSHRQPTIRTSGCVLMSTTGTGAGGAGNAGGLLSSSAAPAPAPAAPLLLWRPAMASGPLISTARLPDPPSPSTRCFGVCGVFRFSMGVVGLVVGRRRCRQLGPHIYTSQPPPNPPPKTKAQNAPGSPAGSCGPPPG